MYTQTQILNTVIPLTISVMALLPFVFFPSLRQKDEDIKQPAYSSVFCYLICLGFAIITLIIIEAALVMGFASATRSLFISTILLVGCLDRAIDLVPQMAFIKADLLRRLAYFVNILCSIPLIWQILMYTIPKAIANNFELMGSVQILLMLIMLACGVVNHPFKKPALKQDK